MKRLFIALLILLTIIVATACKRQSAEKQDGKISVTASIFPLYDIARAIAGGKVQLSMLLPPGAETHSFEPSPKDIITIQHSSLFIYIGGESDKWVERILESLDLSKTKVIALIHAVDAVEEEIIEGMEMEEEEEGAAYDEHIWTDPQNVKRIAQVIAAALCDLDSASAGVYRQNTAAFIASLDELDSAFRTVADNAKRKTLVFGDRFPFRYFADAYGLSYFAAFPGCSTETEPSAATLAFLINKIKNERIPVVFHIELSNEKMADVISEAAGAKKLLLHSVHNISKKDFENGATYLNLMWKNTENLKEALY